MISICYFCLKSGATIKSDLKYLEKKNRRLLTKVSVYNESGPTYVCPDCMKYAQRASVSALRMKDFKKDLPF